VLVATVSVAVTAPATTGVNVTATVQVAAGATVAPHVDAPAAKPAAPGPVIENTGCASGAPPVFVIVSVTGLPATFNCTLPKLTAVFESDSAGGLTPDPFNATACALSASEIVSVPVSGFEVAGANVTEIPHEDPAASVLPQSLTAAKSPAVELTTEVPIPVSGNPPVFEIVTVSGAEICPVIVAGKLRLVVESVSVAPATPVPSNTAACVPTLSFTVRLPAAAPTAVGAKVSVTAHPVPAAREVPQVLAPFTNGAVTVIEVIETALPPTFWTLMVCPALAVPTCTVPKLRLPGCNTTFAVARPVPVSAAATCPPATFALIANAPTRLPAWVGVNATLNVQVAPLATATPTHVSVSAKSPAATPVIPALVTESVVVPVFFSVTVCVAAVAPTVVPANVSEVGLTVAAVNVTPAVASGICHTPRPYVPAVNTRFAAPDGVPINCVTGASGSPVPYGDQHALVPQLAIARVT
jgi:hypothetical protein